MQIYEFNDYKEFLRSQVTERSLTYVQLAQAARMQKQYLSQGMRQGAHLSDEQAFDLARFLELDPEETDFWYLLVKENKISRPDIKNHLKEQIKAIQSEKLKLSSALPKETLFMEAQNKIQWEEYYLDTFLQICHLHLFIPYYQSNISQLAQKLSLSPTEIKEMLAQLLKLGLVEKMGDRYQAKQPLLHLSKRSSLSEQNHRNWRVYALSMNVQRNPDNFRYTGTITADSKTMKKIIAEIKRVIAECHEEIKTAPEENVFQVNIDVFGL